MAGFLAAAPFYPGQNQLVAVVLDAESAYVSKTPLTSGTSLYSADVVRTDSEGHVQLRVRQTRFELVGQSEVTFFRGANGVTELRHGTMVVALNTPSESFEVFVSDLRIIPKNDRPVLATALPEKKSLRGIACHRRHRCSYHRGPSRSRRESRQTLDLMCALKYVLQRRAYGQSRSRRVL
jgi:hypothetical protein